MVENMYNILGWINLLRTCTHTQAMQPHAITYAHVHDTIFHQTKEIYDKFRGVCVSVCQLDVYAGKAQDPKQFALTTSTLNWIKQNLKTQSDIYFTTLSFIKIHINITEVQQRISPNSHDTTLSPPLPLLFLYHPTLALPSLRSRPLKSS